MGTEGLILLLPHEAVNREGSSFYSQTAKVDGGHPNRGTEIQTDKTFDFKGLEILTVGISLALINKQG